MKEVKIRDLKNAIAEAKKIADSVQKDMLWRLEMSVKTCPPEYLRITKMFNEVQKMRRIEKCRFRTLTAVQQ